MFKNFIFSGIKDIVLTAISLSHWVCLFICMIALILYIAGSKKAGRCVTVTFVVNILIQALKVGI